MVSAYRWMVEEDTTTITIPGHQVPNADPNDKSISIDIHNSYAPVLAKGHSTSATVTIDLPTGTPYFVTVMPDAFGDTGVSQYALSGTTVEAEGPRSTAVTVTVNRMPFPTAQIYLIAFLDHNPISNAKDEREDGIGGCSIYIDDFAGNRLAVDTFGHPLGTIYQTDIFGEPLLGPDGAPIVETLGDGALTTLSQDDIDAGKNPYNLKLGEALIKYLAPGKYGVRLVPPQGDDSGQACSNGFRPPPSRERPPSMPGSRPASPSCMWKVSVPASGTPCSASSITPLHHRRSRSLDRQGPDW